MLRDSRGAFLSLSYHILGLQVGVKGLWVVAGETKELPSEVSGPLPHEPPLLPGFPPQSLHSTKLSRGSLQHGELMGHELRKLHGHHTSRHKDARGAWRTGSVWSRTSCRKIGVETLKARAKSESRPRPASRCPLLPCGNPAWEL